MEKEGLMEQVKRIETERMTFKKEKEILGLELGEKIKNLEEEKKIAMERIQKMEENQSSFCDHFSQYSQLYKGSIPPVNFEEMVEFVGEFVDKLEGDNRWLLEKVSENEGIIVDLTRKEEETMRKSTRKINCVDNFVGELERIVKNSEQTHGELQDIQDEYKKLLSGGLSKRNLYISTN